MNAEGAPSEGEIAHWFKSPHPGAFADALPCRWVPFSASGVLLELVKNLDASLSVTVRGIHGRTFTFKAPIPPCDARGLHLAIRWNPASVDLFLNGEKTQSADAGIH